MTLYFSVALSCVLFVADRLLKDRVFVLEKICNTGIAFGVLVFQWLLFIVITALLIYILLLIAQSWRRKNFFITGSLLSIFFGAISNLLDRILYGCVIDYIHFIPYFPWFNIADAMIFIGVLFTGVTYICKKSIMEK